MVTFYGRYKSVVLSFGDSGTVTLRLSGSSLLSSKDSVDSDSTATSKSARFSTNFIH